LNKTHKLYAQDSSVGGSLEQLH